MNLSEYYPTISEKKIPLALLDVSSRVYFNWKKEGLIEETVSTTEEDIDTVKRKNVYLNVYDALWILIIKELRKLNIDLNTIRELKTFLYSVIKLDYDKLNLSSNDEFKNSILNHIPEEFHSTIEPLLNKDEIHLLLKEIIDEETILAFTYLGNLLSSVLLLKRAVSLVIIKENEDSELDFFISPNNNNATIREKEELYEIYSNHFSNYTFINIPILPLINKLFEDEKLQPYCIDFGLFNSNEKKLLSALNDNSCKKITVTKYDSQNITFDFTKEIDVRGDQATEIRKLLGLKQYEKVEITYRNDKHLVIKNNTRDK